MKILIIGGNGTIGKRVYAHFAPKHELLVAARSAGDFKVDLADSASISQLFLDSGKVDAIISAAGEAKWAPFAEMSEDDYTIGLKSKLMGQVNLVRIGQHYLNVPGSITLTSGILADQPVPQTTSAAMVNGAIHSFVKAVNLEIKNGIRVNVVCPGLVADSAEKYQNYFPGQRAVKMDNVVQGYVQSVLGPANGEIIRIYD